MDFTLAAAKACREAALVAARSGTNSKPFRFIYLSGIIAERDQTKSLWYMQDFRRIRGQLETALLDFANATDSRSSKNSFESYIVRPGMVLQNNGSNFSLKSMVGCLIPSVQVDVLAMTMLDLASKGGNQRLVENTDLKR